MGNIHVKLFEIRTCGKGDFIYRKSLLTKIDHNSAPRTFGSGELIKHV